MTRNEANTYLALMLAGLNEASDDGVPSGHLYAMLMGRLGEDAHQKYMTCVAMLIKGGLATEAPSHLLTITSAGLDMVAKIEAHFAKEA